MNSNRISGGCYGSVYLQRARAESSGELFGFLEVATGGGVFTGYQNANIYVLDMIKRLLDEIPNE